MTSKAQKFLAEWEKAYDMRPALRMVNEGGRLHAVADVDDAGDLRIANPNHRDVMVWVPAMYVGDLISWLQETFIDD